MPATVKTEIVGVKDTIKALRRVDPEFRKEFNKAAKDVVAPMVSEAKALYPKLPLSGMARSWTPKAFSIFPWQINKVKTGVKVKTSTRRDKNAVLYVSQGTPSAGHQHQGTARPRSLAAGREARAANQQGHRAAGARS